MHHQHRIWSFGSVAEMMSELRATAAPFQPATSSSNILSTPVTSAVQNKPSDASIMTQQRPRTVRSVPLHERLPLAAPRCAATGLDAGLDASVRRGSVDDLEVRVLVERQELFNATVRRRACEAPMTALTCVTPPPEAAAAAAEDTEAGSPSAMALLPADLLSSLLLSSPETRLIGAQLPPPVATWLPSGLLSTPRSGARGERHQRLAGNWRGSDYGRCGGRRTWPFRDVQQIRPSSPC